MVETKTEVNCDLCGSNNKKFIKSEEGYPISKCLECSLIYVNQLPSIENNKIPGEYYEDDRTEIENIRVRYKDVTKYLLDEINDLFPNKGNFLDVGCGYGFLLKEAEKDGWEVVGTDLSEVAVEYVRTHQNIPNVFCADITDEKISKQKYDVINFTNVFEHIPSPTELLKSCDKILADGGFLMIRVPNMNFYNLLHKFMFILKPTKLLKGAEINYLASPPPFHLIGFTPRTLSNYLKKGGYNSIEIKPSKLSGHRKGFLTKMIELVVGTIYAISFQRINLSTTMIAIARK